MSSADKADTPTPARLLWWMGSSKEDLSDFPLAVKKVVGFALRQAQNGRKHVDAKPLKGHKGASVLEVVEDFDSDTYRLVYTVRFKKAVFVLHAFMKKSKSGAKTPKHVIDLVNQRLKEAKVVYENRFTGRTPESPDKGDGK